MTEEILNKKVSEIVEVLKGTELTEEELFKLMYENEKIYQIVLNDKLCKEEKALSISNVIEDTPKGKMIEKCYNENFESVLNALKIKRMKIDEVDLLCYMVLDENINQLVLSKFCSEKKARLIIKVLKEKIGERENITKRSTHPLHNNFIYARRSKIKNRK